MDFKSPKAKSKNKFDAIDIDDMGEEVVLVDNSVENTSQLVESKNPEKGLTTQNGTQASGALLSSAN